MDISTIQCFVSVARCLNFTKAARECHITQTAMSKKINSLENELGAALFYRDNRQVELTPAGIEFLSRTGVLLEAYADAVYHTQNVANGFESSLKLGIGVYEHLILHNVLSQYASVFPKADIICSQFLYKALAEHLNDRLIDVIISTDQYLQQIPNAEYIVLDERPWRFICSRKHPLASRDNIRLSEFSKECFITMNDGTDEQIRRNYIPHGFTFRRFYRVNSYNTKLLMTRAGLGVSVVPQFVVPYLPKDLCPLDTSPAYRVRKFVAAWLRDNNNPAVKNFTDILASAIGQPDFLQSPPPRYPVRVYWRGFLFSSFLNAPTNICCSPLISYTKPIQRT